MVFVGDQIPVSGAPRALLSGLLSTFDRRLRLYPSRLLAGLFGGFWAVSFFSARVASLMLADVRGLIRGTRLRGCEKGGGAEEVLSLPLPIPKPLALKVTREGSQSTQPGFLYQWDALLAVRRLRPEPSEFIL